MPSFAPVWMPLARRNAVSAAKPGRAPGVSGGTTVPGSGGGVPGWVVLVTDVVGVVVVDATVVDVVVVGALVVEVLVVGAVVVVDAAVLVVTAWVVVEVTVADVAVVDVGSADVVVVADETPQRHSTHGVPPAHASCALHSSPPPESSTTSSHVERTATKA
jgi:hypothetical protein